jgi:hypothetical protein
MRDINHRHTRLGNVLPAAGRSPLLARVGVAGAAFVVLAVAVPEVAASAQAGRATQAKPAATTTLNAKSNLTSTLTAAVAPQVAATAYNGTLVIKTAGTVISGKSIKGSIEVLANNVRIEHSSVTSSNAVVIEIPAGITGTVIYSATVTCLSSSALASGPGALSASKLKVVGCAKPGTVPPAPSPTPAPTSPTPAPTSATPAPTSPTATPTSPAPTSPAPSSPAPSSPAPSSPAPTSPAPTSPAPTTPAGSAYTYVPMVTNMKPTAQMTPNIWPASATTGVPAGTNLKASGPLSISVDGTVINGLNIAGCVDIHASNVTIENSRITCSRNTPAVRVFGGVSNLKILDSEINGTNSVPACIGYSNFTLLRDNLHNCVDGINGSGNVVVEYTYVHDLARLTGTHNDTFQTFGGAHMLLLGNNFQAYNASTSDPMNAAIQTGHLTSALTDVLVVGNMFDGGNYTVNAGAQSTSGYVISGYVFSGNRFGRDARYGPIAELGTGISFDKTNVWADSGLAVH